MEGAGPRAGAHRSRLLEILDAYERYAVALVDKRYARLFTVFLGEIEESKAFEDFVFTHHGPGRLVAGQLPAAPRGPRLSALEKVAERLTELYRRRAFDRLRRAA
jgi:hypothetical protein